MTGPTLYFEQASTIGFSRSVRYGFGVLETALQYRLARLGWAKPSFLSATGRRL